MDTPENELSPDEIAVFRRNAEHYADRLTYLASQELAGNHDEATHRFDEEWGQFELVHEQVLNGGFDDGSLAYRYFLLSAELRRRRRPAADYDRGADAALRYARSLGPLRYAEVLALVAIARQEMSRPETALESAREAVDVVRNMPGRSSAERDQVLAQALAVLGAVLHDLRQLDESLLVLGEGLVIAERLGTREPLQQVLVNMGITLREMSDHEASLWCHQRALELSERSGDLMVIQRQRANVAESLRHLGRLEEARRVATDALAEARKLRDNREEGGRLLQLAAIALQSDDLDAGEQLSREAHDIAEAAGDSLGVVDALRVRAEVYDRSGRTLAADELRRQATEKLAAGGRAAMADQVRSHADERQAAAESIDRALEVSEKTTDALRKAYGGDIRGGLGILYRLVESLRDDDPALLGLSLYSLGRVLTLAGRPAEALEAHMEAIEVDGDSPATVQNMLAKARLLDEARNLPGAIAAYEETVLHCRSVANQGEPLGLALAALGRLAWQVNAYRAAARALADAAGILRAAGSTAVDQVVDDQRRLPAARATYEAAHRGGEAVLSDAELRSALQAAVIAWQDERKDSVTVRLDDGQVIAGKLNLALYGTVPLLILRCAGRDTLLPVERASAITIA